MKTNTELARRLGLETTIVQGPFGGGYSTARLAAVVSASGGGLGSFGAHHLAPTAIIDTARSIRSLTGKPFGLNLWVSNRDYEGALPQEDIRRMITRLAPCFRELGLEPPATSPLGNRIESFEGQAQAVIEARPAVFSFVFGVPPAEVLRACRPRGILTIGAATTLDEAKALAEADVDAIVASGLEAEGHRPSFLARAEDSLMGVMSLTPQIVNAVRVPVIAAGGIADRRGVVAAMQLGAQAVQVGTAFLACEESGAPELHRNLLFGPSAQRTLLSRASSGRLARGIRNRLHDELSGGNLLPYPLQGWVTALLRQAALERGREDLIALWCGQSASLLRFRRAGELLAALAS
ncbi:MAG: nitronate monooxygenase [Acidobacteria bacterium]|nr:nitronate monooxygenase [Acidobacteriota bacterium]